MNEKIIAGLQGRPEGRHLTIREMQYQLKRALQIKIHLKDILEELDEWHGQCVEGSGREGVRTSFVARVSHEAISEVEPLSTDI